MQTNLINVCLIGDYRLENELLKYFITFMQQKKQFYLLNWIYRKPEQVKYGKW